MRPAVFTVPVPDASAICASQTTAGPAALIINGTLLDQQTLQISSKRIALLPGIQRILTFASAGNLAGVNFTIIGKDTSSQAVTEVVAGPNSNGTVASVNQYHEVDSVTASGTVATAVTVGTGTNASTQWWTPDIYADPFNIGLFAEITATLNATVQYTPEDPNVPSTVVAFNHPTMAAITSNTDGNIAFPVSGVRAIVNSANASGVFKFTIIQAGV